MLKRLISLILAALQTLVFNIFTKNDDIQTLGVISHEKYQTFESFGTSSAWWSQNIGDEKTADEIARLLYDDETGLGLDVYRYNIGGGEHENPDCRIWDTSRRTESFYVLNEETGEYEYDFTRDANARRMLDYAVRYGASQVILFCNSPHFSMTKSGHASGGLEPNVSNLPKENYAAFVDYVLTIADWFVEQGYPVTAISPINEPQWSWGGEWVGQEGCHYTADETVEVLEMFALEMQKRGCKYKLSGPESGQLTEEYFDYVDKFFASEILNGFCDSISAHSYWIDNNWWAKSQFAEKMAKQYPDKKFEMSEWCELPMTLDPNSIESGLYMANVIMQDLSWMNAVSWQSWTAVNGDGVLDLVNGELVAYSRYYAYKQFSSFIKPGMSRVRLKNSAGDESSVSSIAFADENQTVIIIINNEDYAQDIGLYGNYESMEIYRTDAENNCNGIYSGEMLRQISVSPKSITTIIYEN
ncbi:MAG: hypothetical protein J6R20_03085 [Clostridia bacterium]|nr:hypothetical protein [Clostridia bacterium]